MLDMWWRFSQIHIYIVFIIDNATPSILGYSSVNGAPSRIKASRVLCYRLWVNQVNVWCGKIHFRCQSERAACQRNKNKSMNCHPRAVLVSVLVQCWETRHLFESDTYKAILSSDDLKQLMFNPLFNLELLLKACFTAKHSTHSCLLTL